MLTGFSPDYFLIGMFGGAVLGQIFWFVGQEVLYGTENDLKQIKKTTLIVGAILGIVLIVFGAAFAEGPHCNAQDWSGCVGGHAQTQTQEVPQAQHPLLHGYLVQGPPLAENEGEAFAFHYRCTAGKDGTTITLQAIEGGPKVKIACTNCRCDEGEK